jgi:hypothetical protein
MGIPSASYSITMRVHLGADPLGIGRITTAVGESAGARWWRSTSSSPIPTCWSST